MATTEESWAGLQKTESDYGDKGLKDFLAVPDYGGAKEKAAEEEKTEEVELKDIGLGASSVFMLKKEGEATPSFRITGAESEYLSPPLFNRSKHFSIHNNRN